MHRQFSVNFSLVAKDVHDNVRSTYVKPLKSSVIIRLHFKCSVPYRPNLSFSISNICALWRSGLSARVPKCRKLTSSSATAERPRDCCVLCLRLKSLLCSCQQLLYVRPALHRTCLCRKVGVFLRGCVTFGEYLTGKGVAHQPLLVSEN